LAADPFSIQKGSELLSKVVATNSFGDSELSEASSAGLFILVPDAPIDLLNDSTVTSANSIKFSWSDGDDGGSVITSYAVYFD
jgi:hypothetical protein